MRQRKNSFLVLCLCVLVVAFIVSVGWNRQSQAAAKTTWEYKTVFVSVAAGQTQQMEHTLSTLGAEGWELVQIVPDVHGYYIFKRPK